MAWRTSGCGCGTGIGCDHGQPVPVCVVQGGRVDLLFIATEPIAGSLVRAEVRSSIGGSLLLDLAPYASASATDPYQLLISVPSEATVAMRSSGFYDVWVGAERVGFGPWLLDLSVSALPGRTVSALSWTPMVVAGESYTREILTAGMLPDGELVSTSMDAAAPEMSVYRLDGERVFAVKGSPWLEVAATGGPVQLNLSAVDTSSIGAGRFTYSLIVYNEYRERRTLLTGMMLVEEAG